MGLLILSDREVTLESGAPGGQHKGHVHGAAGAVPASGACPESVAPPSASSS